MPQSTHDRATELHSIPEHTDASAAASHGEADHLTPHEISRRAHEHSGTKRKNYKKQVAKVPKPFRP
jgi:hypothetical protein